VASFFTASAADRSPALVGDEHGNLPGTRHLSHPMIRQPCAPDSVALFLREADGRALSLLSAPKEQTTHHALEYASSRTIGAIFEHTIPVCLQTSRCPGMAHRPERATRRGPAENETALRPKKTILCVDDNEQVLSVRTFLLETRGYRVIAALSSQQALEVVEQAAPGSLDLLLCDLIMPQMDGNELVRRAKQMQPGLPAMIVSGTVNAFDRASCADVFLPKGASSPAEMIERIRVLVARKRGPKKAHFAHQHNHMMTAAIAS
jgi:two-component system, OmpR family, response regulator CpxR